MGKRSNIFTGFRALGFVSNHIPLCVRYHQKHHENYVVTCVGKAFHVYNCSKFGIVNICNAHSQPLGCSAVDGAHIYVASGSTIYAHTKMKQIKHTYQGHDKPVHTLLPFGCHLIAVDESSCVKVWDIVNEEVFLELQFDNNTFEVTAVSHPNTYVNKLLLASRQGTLQLWNLKTNKQLYNFSGWNSPVTVLQQAPAMDVMAIGLADGRIVLHNIKFDETLMTFTQDWGPVTAISFRTDGHPIMATGSTLGHIALWNLEEKKLQSQMRDAHNSAVTGLSCLPSEPLMITSSPDNSLKMWIFDLPDGGARLLRRRTGHSAPPSTIRYYGDKGQDILSAGQDSTMHSFSTVHERHNHCLGRASYNKKATKKSGLKMDQHMMPAVTCIAAEPSRQSDWDSIIACHQGLPVTTTWNYLKSTMGAHKLVHKRFTDGKQFRHTVAQCCNLSSCGNFAVIGYSSGHVDLYNMQSGIFRGTYGNPTAHKTCVRGVAIDGLNQLTITAGGDQSVCFWKFKAQSLLDTVTLDSQISKILLHRESAMMAIAKDNFQIDVIDIDTRRIVRVFTNHNNLITDMTFSADSRWLVTSCMDCVVRTWDIPTGRLVDGFMTESAVTSVALSPTSDFLATTHVDDVGIYLWSNMTLYSHVHLKPLPSDYAPVEIELPSTSTATGEAEELAEQEDYFVSEFKSPDQISDELVTLSLLPNSRWLSLLNLEVIKQRNKPREPPKVPKSAPFFLPTLPGLTPKFDLPEDSKDAKDTSKVKASRLQPLSKYSQCLQDSAKTGEYEAISVAMKEMGPSAIDTNLRNLAPEGGGSIELMADFLSFIHHRLQTNRDFELIQAYMALFLKLHGDTISRNASLIEIAEKIQASQGQKWHSIQTLFNQSLCLVNYLKSAIY